MSKARLKSKNILGIAEGGTGATSMGAAAVGAVAQIAGIPTGAVVETGSNANGRYTKWADGTMICEFSSASTFTTSNAFGPIYQSGAAAYTFPVAFVGTIPTVVPVVFDSTGALCWAAISGAPSLTGVSLAALSVINTATTKPGYIAKGRWF